MAEGPFQLPQGWQWMRLGAVVEYQGRSIDPSRFPDETFLLYSIPSYDNGMKPEVVEGKQIRSRKLLVDSGVCLFSKLNPRIPRAWIVQETNTYRKLASPEFMPLKPRQQFLDLFYLGRVLLSEIFLRQVRGNVTGATGSRQRLNPQSVLDALIPLPPLTEQRRIVARIEEVLSRVRKARQIREQAKSDAERLMTAALADAFPRGSSSASSEWQWLRLRDVCEYRNGVWGQTDPSGIPVLRSTDFLPDGSLSYETAVRLALNEQQVNKSTLKVGDILLERSGGGPNNPVGRVAYFENSGRYCFGNFVTRLRVAISGIDSRFLFYYLYYFHMSGGTEQLQTQTTNIRNLRFKEYLETLIPLPPLARQREIVAFLDAVHERIKALRHAQSDTEQHLLRLEQAILDKAFRGDL